jgi:methylenetetrahydrofolate dehydrogenase (NADP+)/methenyltetrahydrofolate cyclohydrolase
MKLIKGQKIADGILAVLKKKIKKEKLKPGLAVILVGEDKASKIYVALKKKAARKIGVEFSLFKFGKNIQEEKVIDKVKELNKDEKIHGILIQLPLPAKFDTQKIINAVDYRKDADGFHPRNVKLFSQGKELFWPVFPKAIVKILEYSSRNLKRKNAVVVANSKKFGEAMKVALKKKELKAKYVLSRNLRKINDADIVITAVGKPGLIRNNMIKKGAIIIDGGIAKIGKKTLGDVDIKSVRNIAGFVSPVPGGVGPVTVATLMENVYLASKNLRKK